MPNLDQLDDSVGKSTFYTTLATHMSPLEPMQGGRREMPSDFHVLAVVHLPTHISHTHNNNKNK